MKGGSVIFPVRRPRLVPRSGTGRLRGRLSRLRRILGAKVTQLLPKPGRSRIALVAAMPEDRNRETPHRDGRRCRGQAKTRRKGPCHPGGQGHKRARGCNRGQRGQKGRKAKDNAAAAPHRLQLISHHPAQIPPGRDQHMIGGAIAVEGDPRRFRQGLGPARHQK